MNQFIIWLRTVCFRNSQDSSDDYELFAYYQHEKSTKLACKTITDAKQYLNPFVPDTEYNIDKHRTQNTRRYVVYHDYKCWYKYHDYKCWPNDH